MGQDMLSAFCPCVSSFNFAYSNFLTPLAILALFRACGPDPTHLVPNPVGTRPRVRQGGGPRLASSEPSPIFRPCPRRSTVHYGSDRDRLVHVGLMFGAAKVQGETYIGSAGSVVGSVILLGSNFSLANPYTPAVMDQRVCMRAPSPHEERKKHSSLGSSLEQPRYHSFRDVTFVLT